MDINMEKHKSHQREALKAMNEFRKALNRHFEVVDANARRLIDTRWGEENG
jgi:hypothetical protein